MFNFAKLSYLFKCILASRASKNCPSCGSHSYTPIISKVLGLTSLVECNECSLRYRLPLDENLMSHDYYAKSYYQEGLTSDLPEINQLEKLKDCNFSGTEKDFSRYFQLFDQISEYFGTKLNVCDFGANWGYTQFQLRSLDSIAMVDCVEVNEENRQYGISNLDANYIDPMNPDNAKYHVVFCSHVIEHLVPPQILLHFVEKSLIKGGIVLLSCPNGSDHARMSNKNWNKQWGLVHPNFINDKFLINLFSDYKGVICEGESEGSLTFRSNLFGAKLDLHDLSQTSLYSTNPSSSNLNALIIK